LGVDYAVPVGTPVVSPAAGVVTFAGVQSGFGNTVQIDYGGGFQATYGHLSQILVGVGQSVGPGDTLALSGNTGLTTGPHLHFQVALNGAAVDPASWLAGGNPQLASAFPASAAATGVFDDGSSSAGVDPVLAAVVAGVTGLALAVAFS
jgi:murein DD-endopeptidase MepM/ murein hydrolase activator NlpD